MTTQQDSPAGDLALEHRAAALKERIYISFSALAVVLVLLRHAEQTSAAGAATTLAITVIGTLLAVFAADILSHLTVHARLPDRAELRQMVGISIGSIGVIVLPLIFLALDALGVWSTATALRSSVIVLLVTLVFIGFLAVRRVVLPFWQKLLVLLGEVVLGAIVIVLQLISHGA